MSTDLTPIQEAADPSVDYTDDTPSRSLLGGTRSLFTSMLGNAAVGSGRDPPTLAPQHPQDRKFDQLTELVASLASEIKDIKSQLAGAPRSADADSPADRQGNRSRPGSPPQPVEEEDALQKRPIPFSQPSDYLSHAYYREEIETGYERQRPSKHADNKPHTYQIDDEVTRSLANSKFTAKLSEYTFTCCHGFFLSCSHAALLEAYSAIEADEKELALELVRKIANTVGQLQDMERDRKLYLALNSDPNANAERKEFARTVLAPKFQPNIAAWGGSRSANASFAAWEDDVERARRFASAKALANQRFLRGDADSEGKGKKKNDNSEKNKQKNGNKGANKDDKTDSSEKKTGASSSG